MAKLIKKHMNKKELLEKSKMNKNKKMAPKNNIKENKPNLSLLPFDVLELDAIAYQYGTFKYQKYSWMKGFETSELIASALRHIKTYFWEGEKYDKEAMKEGFKMHHLASARFCLASIIHAELEGLGNDDRPCYELKSFLKKEEDIDKKDSFLNCPKCKTKFQDKETLNEITKKKLYINGCPNCDHN